jgi:hypothetical protein
MRSTALCGVRCNRMRSTLQPYVAMPAHPRRLPGPPAGGITRQRLRAWRTHGVSLGVLQVDLAAQHLVSTAVEGASMASALIARVATLSAWPYNELRGAPAPQAGQCSTAVRGPHRPRLRLRRPRQLRHRLRRWASWLVACRHARRRAQSSRCPASPAAARVVRAAPSRLRCARCPRA